MTSTENPTKWHLRDNWAPVLDELTETDLRVEGTIPPELLGTYLRTGPNPASGQSDHWFFGDGMVHGIRLANGKAEWYRNRFVQTPNIADPIADPMAGMGDLTRGRATRTSCRTTVSCSASRKGIGRGGSTTSSTRSASRTTEASSRVR